MEYVHQPLPTPDSIRLLDLQHLDGDDIVCSLQSAPMGGDAEYTAVSYSWAMDDGDMSICERILIDGISMGVTRNLFHGLLRIMARPERAKSRLIWVDAICIDQTNVKERSAQVARMAEIYSNAAEVVAWLGECGSQAESANVAIALECFSQPTHEHFREHLVPSQDDKVISVCLAHAAVDASHVVQVHKWRSPNDGSRLQNQVVEGKLPLCVRELFDLEELKSATEGTHRVLQVFLLKRYWSRLWVIQEIYHAEDNVRLLWAGYEIPFEQLINIIHSVLRVHWYSPLGQAFGDADALNESDGQVIPMAGPYSPFNICQVPDYRRWYGYDDGYDDILLRVLRFSTESHCSDPRDRLYALLSLDRDSRLRPDYSLTHDQVWISFVVDRLERGISLHDLLCAAVTSKITIDIPDSWKSAAPDFWSAPPNHQDDISASLPSWCLDLRGDHLICEVRAPLGPWTITVERTLICHALVIGSICSNINGGFGGITAWPDLPASDEILRLNVETGSRMRISWHISNLPDAGAPSYSRPGDLVCFFRRIRTDLDEDHTADAIMVRPVDCDGVARVVGIVKVFPELQRWESSKSCYEKYGPLHDAVVMKELEEYAYHRRTLYIC